MTRFLRGLLGVVGIGGVAIACNAILGADEPIIDEPGVDGSLPDTDSTIPFDGNVDADAGADVLTADADADAADTRDSFTAPSCGDASIIDIGPLYVLPDGDDTASCGSQDAPCKTIRHGLDVARTIGKTVLRVAQGTYEEQLVLPVGYTIEGGWIALKQAAGFKWYSDCRDEPAPSSDAVLLAPANVDTAVTAKDLDGSVVLSTLSVEMKSKGSAGGPGQPGQSLYGVAVWGEKTDLTLKDVLVHAGQGGDGDDGKSGAVGGAMTGDCPPGGGGIGGAGDFGDMGDGPTFDLLGFVPKAGGTGGVGHQGQNGPTGTSGGCEICCVGGLLTACGTNVPSCGATGKSGCGGNGGTGGTGGQGGGASVALFVADGHVNVLGGELRAAAGGKGGNGGTGGPGAAGSKGSTGGAGPSCATTCSILGCSDFKSGAGGDGSRGGSGGTGGRGGGGAGGSSFAYVVVGTGEVTVNDAGITPGPPGAGGLPNGGPGASGDQFPVPP